MSNYFRTTGIKWLQNIPQEWEIIKLKFLCNISTGNKDTQDKLEEGEYPFFVRSPHIEKLNEYTYDGEAIMTAGDGVGVGKVFHYFNGKFAAHQRVYIFTDFNKVLGKYIYYYLMANLKFEVLLGGAKSTVDSIRRSMLSEFPVAFPSQSNQKIIVKYLDTKVKEIEEIIILKEKEINLLEEKRQSTITEVVTKGLNSNVKMKDSAVEWIGEIPEHWEKSKLGYLGRLQNGISKPGDEFGYGSPFVSYGDVYKNIILPSQVDGLVNTSIEEQKLYSVEQGDIFFTRTSETIDEIGFASVCLKTIPKATFAGFLIKFRPNLKKISPNFAKYYFRSDLRKHYFIKEMNIVTRASLGQGLLRNFPVLLPSLIEQEEIAYYLDEEVLNINKTISLMNDQIQKLKEYRQSLIYEAVTGKIDVRELVAEK